MADETKKFMSADNLLYVWQKMKTLLGEKVEKVDGKGLSSNDYTSAEKTKLAGIASGAQVNTLEGIQVNGTNVTPTNKIVNLDLSGYGASLSYNSTTGVITLKNKSGTTLSTIDLPIESVVVSGKYDETSKKVILTLQNGTTIEFSIASLVSGLVNTDTLKNYYTKTETIDAIEVRVPTTYVETVTVETSSDTIDGVNATLDYMKFTENGKTSTLNVGLPFYKNATTALDGLMSAEDKTKLNGLSNVEELTNAEIDTIFNS